MRRIRLTRHARNRMRWHELAEDVVKRAVQEPDRTESSQSGRVNRWKRHGEATVRIEYDPDADALYILIREAPVDDNIDIEDGVTVDVDAEKHSVGLEILDVSKRLNPSDLSSITIQRLPVEVSAS